MTCDDRLRAEDPCEDAFIQYSGAYAPPASKRRLTDGDRFPIRDSPRVTVNNTITDTVISKILSSQQSSVSILPEPSRGQLGNYISRINGMDGH